MPRLNGRKGALLRLIQLENVSKTYPFGGGAVTVLSRVNLRVAKGAYTAIVGPSGSGKSTLMNLIGCLDTPTSGRYLLGGRDVSRLTPAELARVRGETIGFVFQGFQLMNRLTALENVALPLLLRGMPRARRNALARDALCRVGLENRTRHRPSELSGGQQQRVAIARALVYRPRVLLADEPTGNLDEAATRDVLALLAAVHRDGATVVLITHDRAVAERAGSRVEVAGGAVRGADDHRRKTALGCP